MIILQSIPALPSQPQHPRNPFSPIQRIRLFPQYIGPKLPKHSLNPCPTLRIPSHRSARRRTTRQKARLPTKEEPTRAEEEVGSDIA